MWRGIQSKGYFYSIYSLKIGSFFLRRWFLFLLLVFSIPYPIISQTNFSKDNFKFEPFTLPGGVLGNQVQDIVQDKNGFLWFATKNGLFKYDGRTFKSFNKELYTKNSMSTKAIECLLFDTQGFLWIGTYGGGLIKFDAQQEEVIGVLNDPNYSSKNMNNYVYQLLEDEHQNIWAGTSNGLYIVNQTTFDTYSFKANINDPTTLQNSIIWQLYQDKKGTIWVGTGFPWEHNPAKGGLHRYNPINNNFTRFLQQPNLPNSLADNRVRAIFEDSYHNFWVGTMGEGLNLMDRNKETFKRLGHQHKYSLNISQPFVQQPGFSDKSFNQVTFVHEDIHQRLWIGAINGGLNIYDPKSNQQLHFEAQTNTTNTLNSNYLFNIFETKDQTVFLCNGDGGDNTITKVTYSTNLFTAHYFPQKDLSTIHVQSFLEVQEGKIWIGTMGEGGLFLWDSQQNKIEKSKLPLQSNNIHALGNDQEGNLWIGYLNKSFEIIYPDSNKILPNPIPIQDPSRKRDVSINKIIEDSKGNKWIPTRFNNVSILQPNQNIKRLTFNPEQPYEAQSIGGTSIDRVIEDEQGFIWLFGNRQTKDGVFSLVIDKYHPKTDSIQHFLKENQERGYIPSIDRDKNGNFWFTNSLDGIKKFNPKTGQLTTINTANSRIPSDEIRALVIDDLDNIWMSTKHEIISFNPSTRTFQTFGLIDGVSIELSFGAILKQKNGHLLFGGKKGFLELDPTIIEQTKVFKKPPIKISQLLINNLPINFNTSSKLPVPIWANDHLVLEHDEHNFTFGLTCLDYHTTDNYIEYKLEGYDNFWRTVGPEKLAVYIKVPPGDYTFKTRGANQKGTWNEEGQQLTIKIHQPWWQTWWAYALACILLFSIILAIYRFQLNRQKIKQETENLRALDDLKTRLYANITHEFRTPLTLILGLAKQIKKQGKAIDPISKATNIEKSGKHLLLLVNQLLDLRKLEVGQTSLNLVQGNVIPLFHYFFDNFESLAESRAITLVKNMANDPIIMDHDQDKLHKIVSNLLANALKFTPKGGYVFFQIKTHQQKLNINIKDTGIGIPTEQIPHIFDRFYRSDTANAMEGTGIGLALVKELVQLMQGEIEVKSIPEVGSEFIVQLPITNQAILTEAMVPTKGPNLYATVPILTDFSPIQTVVQKAIILIVEDNAAVAQFTASCLQAVYTVHFAKDGQAGETKAFELVPDLIISDVMMPQKNGFQLCETLKMDERTSHIPIILLTARADFEDKLTGLQRGADAYLAKPFHEQELNIRVEQLILQREKLKTRYTGLILKHPSSDKALKIEDEFVLKIRALIEANLDQEDFGVADISKAIFLSRTQVHRKLKALTQKSTGQYIRAVRLHHALEMIKETDKSITEIAYDVGFKDPAYFSRVFSEEFGRPPSQMERNG